MRSELDGPFGAAAVRTALVHTVLPQRACAPPDVLYERLRREGVRGQALLQTGDGEGLAVGRRSVLVARPLLRCELRGDTATFTPLVESAAELLALLAGRLRSPVQRSGALLAELPRTATAAGSSDACVLAAPSALDVLRAAAGLLADDRTGAPLPPGLFGALGYELVDRFEQLGPRKPDPLDEPDASLVLAGDVVIWEHATGRVHVLVRGLPWEPATAPQARLRRLVESLSEPVAAVRPDATPSPPGPTGDDRDFLAGVLAVQRHVRAGDVFQAVLSRRVTLRSAASPLAVYRALAAANPSPFQFLLELGEGELLGASPETFLRVAKGRIELRPIAGTAPRGLNAAGEIDADRDQRLALALLLDAKEQAEHAMLLDLARNDVARISRPGTTRVAQLFAVQKFARVQHLTSRVVGELRAGLDALHAWRGVANMGTLTGAPKPRAMELVRELEPTARGFYGGAVGFVLQDGSMDSCIAIRCLRARDGAFHAQAGAGIVLDSEPHRELLETELKLRSLREAVTAAGTEVAA